LLEIFITSLRFLRLLTIKFTASLPVNNALAKFMISGRKAVTIASPPVKAICQPLIALTKVSRTPIHKPNEFDAFETFSSTLSPDNATS